MIDTTTKARIRREAEELEHRWATDPRWRGIERPYSAEDVVRLRGSVRVEHTIARLGAERLWDLLGTRRLRRRARRPDRRPGRRDGEGRARRRSTCRAGRWRPTRTSPARPTPTSRCTPPTRCRRWSAGSTTRCMRADQIAWSEGSRHPLIRRSSPTPRPGSAAR